MLQVRILLQDLLEAPTRRHETHHGLDRHPKTADARPALQLVRLDGDPVERHATPPCQPVLEATPAAASGSVQNHSTRRGALGDSTTAAVADAPIERDPTAGRRAKALREDVHSRVTGQRPIWHIRRRFGLCAARGE